MIWRHSSLSKTVLPWDRHKRNLVQSSAPSFKIGQKICILLGSWNEMMIWIRRRWFTTQIQMSKQTGTKDISLQSKPWVAKYWFLKSFFLFGRLCWHKVNKNTKDPISHLPILEFVPNKKFQRSASTILYNIWKPKCAFLF